MSEVTARVRALRPHDTVWGMKNPGDDYERPLAEAETLAAGGVVKIIKGSAGKPAK